MIYFVGMHNKPGMTPLDSRTYTGKVIDKVIERVGEAKKTNLADTNELPLPKEIFFCAVQWNETHRPKPNDTIILLGKWTQKHFFRRGNLTYIEAAHPSAFEVRRDKQRYIYDLVNEIQKHLMLKH